MDEKQELKNKLKQMYEAFKKDKVNGCINAFIYETGGENRITELFPTMREFQDLMEYAGYCRMFAFEKARAIYKGIKIKRKRKQ